MIPRRILWIDTARGIAIIAVVFFHAALLLGLVGYAPFWNKALELLETLRMPLFLFVSGLVSYKLPTYSFKTLWNKRLSLLLYLYAVWVAGRTLYVQFMHPPALDPHWQDAFKLFTSPHTSLWFLYALALYAITIWALRGVNSNIVLIAAALISVLALSGLLPIANLEWLKTVSYFFFYVAGINLRAWSLRKVEQLNVVTAVILITVYLGVSVFNRAGLIPSVVGVRFIICILGVAAGVALASLLVRIKGFGWVALLGRRTMPIYLIHFLPLLALSLILSKVTVQVPMGVQLIFVPIAVAISILVALALYKLLAGVPGVFTVPWKTRVDDPGTARRAPSQMAQPDPESPNRLATPPEAPEPN